MIVYPDIDPEIVSFGPIEIFDFVLGPIAIRWYGLMYVIGFLVAWWLARRRAQAGHSPIKDVQQADDLIFYAMLGVILGGRIGHALFYSGTSFADDPLYLLRIWEGGMSFHGGLLGVMFAMWWFGRKLKLTMWQVTDFMAPFVPLGLGFGRIGNFINGELWGKETDVPWGVLYDGVVRHPSQLYESILEGFLLFAILWWFSAKPRPYMAVSGLFLVLYGVFRFAVEFVRLPDQPPGYLAFGWVTMGQVLSAPMILVGATMLYMAYGRKKTEASA